MCFSVDVKYTPSRIIMCNLNYIMACTYCKKDVSKKVYVCPYCTCKLGHLDCITNNTCPFCEEWFELS